MFVKKILKHQLFLVFVIFFFSLSLRLFGLNWDQGQHLHPDERFLTMLITTIRFPNSIIQYFNTQNSPLNPFNYQQFNFFVYGTFPVFLVKFVSQAINFTNYDNIHFVGRTFSAIFDSLNIFTLYFLSKLIFPKDKKNFLFLPSLFYSLTVLPIQLSHFFTVDTFLNFFILASFTLLSYWLKTQKNLFLFFAAIAFGLSLSCKISAALFVLIIFLFFIYQFCTSKKHFLILIILFTFTSFLIFRIFQPYSFLGLLKINPSFINSLTYLKSILISKNVFYPPEIQWLSKTPFLYPLQNIIIWGLGLPLSILLILSFKNIFHLKFKKIFSSPTNFIIFLSVIWTLFLLFEQGFQFTSTMRYFLPIYPFFCFLAVLLNLRWFNCRRLFIVVFLFHFYYAFIFISIYTRPNSRVQATNWIYKNIPSTSKIANEYWDDALPLYSNPTIFYSNQMLPLYDPDTIQKWDKINTTLKNTDYLFLTSNRLWGSIPKVSTRYPIATKYYQDLFDNKLMNFKKIIEFDSYPGISLPFLNKCILLGPTNFPYLQNKNHWFDIDSTCLYPGIYLRDDTAEEAFSVYDHPKVVIFQKKD
jgi:hypothetical protein